MAVATDAPSEDVFAGTGTAAPLVISWRFLDADDLVVTSIVDAVELEAPLTRGIDYTVTGGGSGGGTVVPALPLPVGTSWRVRRETPKGQPASLPTGNYNPKQIEQALDRQSMALQEQDREIARGARVPRGEAGYTLPPAAERAGRFIAHDALGNPVPSVGTGADAGFRVDLAAEGGAALIGYKRNAAGAVNVPASARNDALPMLLTEFDTFQEAAQAAITEKRELLVPGGEHEIDTLAFAVAPDSNTAVLTIRGEGPHASRLVRKAGSGRALVDITTSSIPTEAHVNIADLSIDGLAASNGDTGIRMTGIANWRIENVLLDRCDIGLDLAGSLTGVVDASTVKRGRLGMRTRVASGVYCNAVTAQNSRFKYNTERGLDIGGASLFRLIGGTVEENGTAGNAATGGMIVRSNVATETGFGIVEIDGAHFERNHGWQFDAEAMAAGKLLSLLVKAVPFLSSESNRAMRVAGAEFVMLEGVEAASPGDIVEITASKLVQVGGTIAEPDYTTVTAPLILLGAGLGNVMGDLHLDGNRRLRLSWANNSAGFEIRADTFGNNLYIEATGAAIARALIALDWNLTAGRVYKINGTQVVSGRVAGDPGAATDAATTQALANWLRNVIVTNGLGGA